MGALSRLHGSPTRPLMHSPSRLRAPVAKPRVVLYTVVLGLCALLVVYHVVMLPVWGHGKSEQGPDMLSIRKAGALFQAGGAHQLPVHSLSCRKLTHMSRTPHSWKQIPIGENGKFRFGMWVYNSSDIVSDSLNGGTWEAWELSEMEWAMGRYKHAPVNASGQQPVFVDVGANVGWYTLVMSLRNYTVLAFEGMRENAQMIARSLCDAPRLAKRITLTHTGLGAAPSRCYIYSHSTNLGDGHTLCGQHTPEAAARLLPAGYKIRDVMQIARLDDLILPRFPPGKPFPPLVLKIDVEGFEFEVFKGAVQLLARGAFHYILAERDPGMMSGISGPEGPRDFLYFILGFGYSISDKSFDGPFVAPGRITEFSAHWGKAQKNLYLVHKSAPTAKNLRLYKPDEL